MTIASQLSQTIRATLRRMSVMLPDRRGVAAIEFAFIVPVLLCMYFITMEASQGLVTDKKVSRIGSMAADLITQQTEIQVAEVVAIMQIAEAIIQPYNRSDPTLDVTAIKFNTDATPKALVVWSVKLDSNNNPVRVAAKGTEIPADTQLANIRAPGAFYIRVRSSLEYQPVITWSQESSSVGLLTAFNNISMGQTYYWAPRNSSEIKCTSCPI
jgi:Flp pilus assembly protein TadG